MMENLLLVIILAVVQGIAEFLPVSSSGHLLVLGNWFGFDAEENMFLNVVLHAGTLLAILIFYFRKLWSIVSTQTQYRVIGLVIAGSLPVAAVGIGMKISNLETVIFSSPYVAAVGFIITATLLLIVFGLPWKKQQSDDEQTKKTVETMSFRQALLVGCVQAIAITPGISRSGSTFCAGVFGKLRKADAAEFSFLLAIPAIGGAALLEMKDIIAENTVVSAQDWLIYLAGFVVSAVVGYAALAGLISMLRRGKLGWFACYLYAAALVVLTVQIFFQ